MCNDFIAAKFILCRSRPQWIENTPRCTHRGLHAMQPEGK